MHYFLLLISIIFTTSCKETNNINESNSRNIHDSVINLKGVLHISSKGNFILDKYDTLPQWNRKIELITESKKLREYVEKSYDSFLYLRNSDDHFWVSITGYYLTADTLPNPAQFRFSSISLIDKMEAITDSSQALREIVKESK